MSSSSSSGMSGMLPPAGSKLKLSSSSKRVIMHVDCDCYYAQIERERFPHFRHSPLAVVQQGSFVVTSNYRCRARGLPKSWYLSPQIDKGVIGPNGAAAEANSMNVDINYSGSKMSRYRAGCRTWQKCFEKFDPRIIVMRRGIDECYLDLTALALDRARKGQVKVLTNMKNDEFDQQKAQASARFARAEEEWKKEEANLPDHLKESLGGVHAAVAASISSDPMTTMRTNRHGTQSPFLIQINHSVEPLPPLRADTGLDSAEAQNNNNDSSNNQGKRNETDRELYSAHPTPAQSRLVPISKEPILACPPHLIGKSEAEIEAHCNSLHPEDYCRAQKGYNFPVQLYERNELTEETIPIGSSPYAWVGQVILSGTGDEEVKDSRRPSNWRYNDNVSTGVRGSHFMDVTVSYSAEHEKPISTLQREKETGGDPSANMDVNATVKSSMFPCNLPLDWTPDDHVPLPAFPALASPPSSIGVPPPVAPQQDPSHDLLLCIGSQIAFEIRQALFRETGLTTSCCVAPNCMLAKMGSSLRKPNQQSVIRPSIVFPFLRPLKLKAVPRFGPVSQAKTDPYGIVYIAQLQNAVNKVLNASVLHSPDFAHASAASASPLVVSSPSLTKVFGEAFGKELEEIANGIDEFQVRYLGAPKNVAQEKSQRIRDATDFYQQVEWLANQLGVRLQEHEDMWNKRATNLTLAWTEGRRWQTDEEAEKEAMMTASAPPPTTASLSSVPLFRPLRNSRSTTMPSNIFSNPSDPFAELRQAAHALAQKVLAHELNPFNQLSNVGLGVSTWRELPQQSKDQASISKFLAKSSAATNQQVAPIQTHPSSAKPSVARSISPSKPNYLHHVEVNDEKRTETNNSLLSDDGEPDDLLRMIQERDAQMEEVKATEAKPVPSGEPAVSKPTLILCSTCGTHILSTEEQAHADYHFAAQLQQQVRKEDREQREREWEGSRKHVTQTHVGKPKQKSNGEKASIRNFFPKQA